MRAPRPLCDATLAHHARRVAVPTYDRAALTPAVVHISVGSFHRSHQAVYFDEIAQRGISTDWGLVGVGLQRPGMREALAPQDGLYTVLARGASGDFARVIGVIGRYLYAPYDGAAVLDALADPRTRLVTLTVTGRAYNVDPITGEFDALSPAVTADLASPAAPSSALGYLVEALDRRRRAGLAPFTVLSCDNVAGNGLITRTALVAFARLRDQALADWIGEHVAFPSSMVDRITPRTTEADCEFLAGEFGVRDRWPVVSETFKQWIVEDAFCSGRPPLDAVGVQFVDDVRPYALMKTRLLNAGHCALGHLGMVAGLERMDEAMTDPVFASYAERLMREVTPLLPRVPGIDLDAYREVLLERFANPKIGDSLIRLCRAGSSKVPRHVVSSLAEARATGRPHPMLTLAVAGWMRFLRGADDAGTPMLIDDPRGERLRELALRGGTDPRPLLSDRMLFGALGDDPGFVAELSGSLRAMERDGARAVLAAALGSEQAVAR